jgi:hypothetical protein
MAFPAQAAVYLRADGSQWFEGDNEKIVAVEMRCHICFIHDALPYPVHVEVIDRWFKEHKCPVPKIEQQYRNLGHAARPYSGCTFTDIEIGKQKMSLNAHETQELFKALCRLHADNKIR